MYVLAGVTLGIFPVLLLLSRKEEVEEKGLGKLFGKIAAYLYRQSLAAGLYLFAGRQVEQDLKRLHPHENGQKIRADYYREKLEKCQMIIVMGMLIGLVMGQKGEEKGILFCVGGMVVALLIYVMWDRDLHDKVEKRQQNMKSVYPDIVHKLALYMGAGMTTRGAFCKIAEESRQSEERSKKSSPAYLELQYACRELASGVSETAAYEGFGKRTGVQEYIRLCTLLGQNLRRGNSAILERLREEVEKASIMRIQRGRRMGEEAVTKLLLPMVMMLLVVMLMIMIPAFTTVGV